MFYCKNASHEPLLNSLLTKLQNGHTSHHICSFFKKLLSLKTFSPTYHNETNEYELILNQEMKEQYNPGSINVTKGRIDKKWIDVQTIYAKQHHHPPSYTDSWLQ